MATALSNLTNMPKIPGITPTAPPPEPAAAMTAEAEKIRPKLEEVGTRRAAAETEVGKLAAEKEQFGAEQAVRKAEGAAQAGEQFAQTMREAPMRPELEEKTKQEKDFFFQPSQQDGMQFATLASLLMVLGTSIGKGGKGNAIAALNGLNGMMEGYRKQSDSVYKQEKAAFETNAKALKDQITALRQSLQDYEKMASVDRQAAIQKLDLELAKQGADFMKSRVQRQGVAMLLPELRQQEKHLQTLLDGYDRKIAEAKDKASAASALERERAKDRESLARLTAGLRGPGKSSRDYGSASELVEQSTGAKLKDKDAEQVTIAANAVGDAAAISQIVSEHPEWVGRTGQIKNIFNRTVESLNLGTQLPEDGGQPELIFAKRYAEYLVNYERSLAGGARGFTVFFQRRFNQLLEQNQFNAAGMKNLMNEQMRTIMSRAAEKSSKINRDNMLKLARDIKDRAGDDEAIKGINSFESKTVKPSATTAPSGEVINLD